MLNADEGDPSLDTLNTIEQETERMANLVGNLLEFSRRGTRQVSSLDVREELQNSLELIHYHLKKRNVTVVKEFDENVKMVHADRQQLRQVFLNVMANASDALDGAGKITIRAGEGTLDDKRAAIVIEIEDTGPGISPEVLSKAMDPFFTTKEAGKGTGLGLPICKRIIEEHEGDFTISSEVGKGTTVRIGLPVQNGKNAEQLDCDY
jgi:signal transduction histidine kinase